MANPVASIIIRTKNEERWIAACLSMIYRQTQKNLEVIVIDSDSTDGTLRKAQNFPVKVLSLSGRYRPGKALNEGARAAQGEFLVFLSAHCLPVTEQWLENLLAGFQDATVAGVYGRQQPMAFSRPQDKRDLTITFGLDRRVQRKDPFFHNANSAIRRTLWEQVPFDETVVNIEDRQWAESILARGYCLVYEPEASVYHHHGIHHGNSETRLKTTAQVLDYLHEGNPNYEHGSLDASQLKIVAFVPLRGQGLIANGEPVLRHTLLQAKDSSLLSEVIVLTDNPTTQTYAESLGARVPFLRPSEFSLPAVDLNQVYQFALNELESQGELVDLVVCLEPTYPLRPSGLIDALITQLLEGGYDSVLPVRADYNSCWLEEPTGRRRVDAGDVPRHLKSPALIGIKGLGCVTYPEFLRQGKLLGDRVGLVKIEDPLAVLEVREPKDAHLLEFCRGTRINFL